MSYREWLELLNSAEKASIISGRCRKIHYKFPRGGHQMIEEYSLDTGVLLRRAWKRQKELRGDPAWEIELGDSIPDVARGDDGGFIMKESNSEVGKLGFRDSFYNIWPLPAIPYQEKHPTEPGVAHQELALSTGQLRRDGQQSGQGNCRSNKE